ncbi:hypothetical protein ElyMa_000324300 [Elysia marginata]|uniref:Uncharacterized protein n=1 Tax=Elysia marginata TaxID=1093978 RepID=A0AAV4FD55_9GAST|nr:hypothetical protein ElyMa_000324300 [Elysia marginata]
MAPGDKLRVGGGGGDAGLEVYAVLSCPGEQRCASVDYDGDDGDDDDVDENNDDDDDDDDDVDENNDNDYDYDDDGYNENYDDEYEEDNDDNKSKLKVVTRILLILESAGSRFRFCLAQVPCEGGASSTARHSFDRSLRCNTWAGDKRDTIGLYLAGSRP